MESILRVCNSYHAHLHQLNYTAYNRKVINTCLFASVLCVFAREQVGVHMKYYAFKFLFPYRPLFPVVKILFQFSQCFFFNEQVCKSALQITVRVFSKRFLCDSTYLICLDVYLLLVQIVQ